MQQGETTLANWGTNLGTSLAQDVFVLQVFRVYIIFSMSMVSIKPQLQYIYRVLNRVAISYVQDDLGDNFLDIRVVQHLSPACRISHMKVGQNLATANILRNMDDADVEVCRLRYELKVATIATVMFLMPILFGIINQSAGNAIMRSLFPALLDSALIANYYFYTAAGLFILMPYLITIGLFVWKNKINPAIRNINKLRAAPFDMDDVQRWNSAVRTKHGRSYVSSFKDLFVRIGMVLLSPLSLFTDFVEGWFATPQVGLTADRQWSAINRPADLQARVSSRYLGVFEYTHAARNRELRTAVDNQREMAKRIPKVISDLLVAAKEDWFAAWTSNDHHTVTATKKKKDDYLSSVLNYKLTHVHTVASAGAGDASVRPPTRSARAAEFIDYHQSVSSIEGALNHVLNRYRKYVTAGRMELVDTQESTELATEDSTSCDVLVEFFDLCILLEELLVVYRPYGADVTPEEKEEISGSFKTWVAQHGDSLLELHYDHDTSRIATTMLARVAKTGSINLPTTEPGTVGANQDANYCVPFQQFRAWFLTTGANIVRASNQGARPDNLIVVAESKIDA